MLALVAFAITLLVILAYAAGFYRGQCRGFRAGLCVGQGLEVSKERQMAAIRTEEIRTATDQAVRQNQSAAEAFREQAACETAKMVGRQPNKTAS